ncbi:MAG TPA: XapX domain containing protein [Spirochaetaceae bacterium]|nr:XapX domain containing protein [Spirochaetaceae bacterium]
MKALLVPLGVGLVIGIIFRLLKLPVPVPHGWGGLLGLIGMFIGSEVMPMILQRIAQK